MRAREYLGPSSVALRRSLRVLKSIPCKVCSVLDQSLDGEGIGNLASS